MAASARAVDATYYGPFLPKVWKGPLSAHVGDLILAAFLVVQGLDGFFTYVGVSTYGLEIEANPLVSTLMWQFGEAGGLVGAKAVASVLGICLYFCQVHAVVALLTGFYLTAAIAPWTMILFF